MDKNAERTLEHYRLHADLCKVLTDPKRLMILEALRHGDRSGGELAEASGVALPNASQHLAVMRKAGLVDSRRAGTTIVYRLGEPTIVGACDIVPRSGEGQGAVCPGCVAVSPGRRSARAGRAEQIVRS